MPTSWGESNKFKSVIDTEVEKYLNDQADLDKNKALTIRLLGLIYSLFVPPDVLRSKRFKYDLIRIAKIPVSKELLEHILLKHAIVANSY